MCFDPFDAWCFLTGRGTSVPEHRGMFDDAEDGERLSQRDADLAEDLKAYARELQGRAQ